MLLEREAELGELERCLQRARKGTGRLVLVGGEPGIGKTSLVRVFCEQLRGVRVLRGACDPLATPRPLGPLLDIVDRLGGALTDLDPHASRDALFRGFLGELSSRSWVTVAVVEDAHWADEATLDLLRFLGRRIAEVPALLIVTFRGEDIGRDHPLALLADELAGEAVSRLRLRPLSREAVAALARDRDVEALHRLTGGNPFYVTEVLAADTAELPVTVRDAVLARVSRLAPALRRVVEAAAVVPTRVPVRLLGELAAADAQDVDGCVAAGVLAPDAPGTVAFRHELARRAVDASLRPARRAALNDAAVDLLLAASADPARIAYHADLAGRADVAFDQALLAARQARALGSQREAADQYERALHHAAGRPDDAVAGVLEETVQTAIDADRVDRALDAAERAVALRRRLGDERALGNAMVVRQLALWNAGDSQQAYAEGRRAVELLERHPPGEELANAYAYVATDKMLARDYEGAAHWGEKARRLAEQLGATRPLVRTLSSVGAAKLLAGDRSGADDLRRGAAIAEDAGLDAQVCNLWINLGSAAGEVRDYALAEEGLRRGIAHAAARDFDGLGHYGVAWLARVQLERGEWTEAATTAGRLRLDDERTSAITRIAGLVVLGRLAARGGDLEGAQRHLAAAWDLAARTGDLQRTWPVAAARAEAAWFAGDPRGVLDAVGDVDEQAARIRHPWAGGELGLWRWRAGAAEALPQWAAAPYRLHVTGDHRAAADAWAGIGCPYERADALADSEEVDDLREALDAFVALGAGPAADRVRRRLRARGVRALPRGPTAPARSHPLGLTARQAEVLALVARGCTDAEIASRLSISVKTAGHHVSAILARLEATSRTEAAHRAHRLGLTRGAT